MRYFHRTSLAPDAVLAQAKAFFGARLVPAEETPRRRVYSGSIGKVTISARPEGGHYTLVEVGTDQAGESEVDRLAKRFLAEVHHAVEPTHEVRGAY
jgi:RecB family endonuclease NucS